MCFKSKYFDFLKGLVFLMRPAEWTKTFGNMLLASAMAFYLLAIKINPIILLEGFASVALLWSGLYALNDFIDRKVDAKHSVKKNRPIPSGKISETFALFFAIALLVIAYEIAFMLNNFLLIICLLAMTLNQLLYTLKPIYLKKRAVFDLISGSLINPFFRFYSGWVLFVPAFNAPVLALMFTLGLQFGGYALYRLSCSEHEKALGYNSSAVLFGTKLRNFSLIILLIAGLSFIAMIAIGFFSPFLKFLGWLPAKFFWLVIGSGILLPFYKSAMKNPQKIDMQKMYRILYIHYLFFIIGFIICLFLDKAFTI